MQLEKLKDISDKMKYYETMLGSVSNCIALNLESENCFVSDNVLSAMDNKKIRLSDLVDSAKIIFVRYAEENCGSCIDFIIPFVQKLSDSIGPENVIFLASYDSERLMNIFLKTNKLNNQIYNLEIGKLGLPIEDKNLPYLFIMDKAMRAEFVFIPQKSVPDLTEKYFALLKRTFKHM